MEQKLRKQSLLPSRCKVTIMPQTWYNRGTPSPLGPRGGDSMKVLSNCPALFQANARDATKKYLRVTHRHSHLHMTINYTGYP